MSSQPSSSSGPYFDPNQPSGSHSQLDGSESSGRKRKAHDVDSLQERLAREWPSTSSSSQLSQSQQPPGPPIVPPWYAEYNGAELMGLAIPINGQHAKRGHLTCSICGELAFEAAKIIRCCQQTACQRCIVKYVVKNQSCHCGVPLALKFGFVQPDLVVAKSCNDLVRHRIRLVKEFSFLRPVRAIFRSRLSSSTPEAAELLRIKRASILDKLIQASPLRKEMANAASLALAYEHYMKLTRMRERRMSQDATEASSTCDAFELARVDAESQMPNELHFLTRKASTSQEVNEEEEEEEEKDVEEVHSTVISAMLQSGINPGIQYEEFGNFLDASTRYRSMELLASWQHADVGFSTMVTAVDLDSEGALLAVTGTGSCVKIYDWDPLIRRKGIPQLAPFEPVPLVALREQGRFSSLSWSPHTREHLLSGSYTASILQWDVEKGCIIRRFAEHERRVWDVHHNADPQKGFVSGAEDGMVHLWHQSQLQATAKVMATVKSVQSVRFHPKINHILAVGIAGPIKHPPEQAGENEVQLYDIRKFSHPFQRLAGHTRSVTYVRWMDGGQRLVSSSIDSTIRLWNTEKVPCKLIKSFSSHRNDANMCGLATAGEYVITGSESNKLAVYHSLLYEQVMHRRMTESPRVPDSIYTRHRQTSPFISALTARYDTDMFVVAGNSQGFVEVLRFDEK